MLLRINTSSILDEQLFTWDMSAVFQNVFLSNDLVWFNHTRQIHCLKDKETLRDKQKQVLKEFTFSESRKQENRNFHILWD